jgi:dephospho-CoA kinase
MVKDGLLKVALTGSIAMGKSTVAQMFRAAGVPVFDADAEVHRLYAKGGKAVKTVKALFPDAIVNGSVDRTILASMVLNNSEAIKKLEAVVHPLVRASQNCFLADALSNGAPLVLFDIPLLFETGRADEFDVVLVVSAPAEIQRARALGRKDMTSEKLDAILARQVSDSEKRLRANHVISTGTPLKDTNRQVLDIIAELKNRSGALRNA